MALKITVIGAGYLGATHATAMAELGFEVVGVDVDVERVERLNRGKLPFHEPALPELLVKHISSGRLRFTHSVHEAAMFGDIHFIAVGTPQRVGEHAADMSFVNAAVRGLAQATRKDCLIVGKSTVPVGSARRLQELANTVADPEVTVTLAWNPEFLREGFAVQDTLSPDRLVVGSDSPQAHRVLREIYAQAIERDTPYIETDFETAELVKVAANAFLATKISFINAFAEITEVAGGDIRMLAHAIGLDERIGRKFLNAGVGFGGGCLPKDIRALQARASELGLDTTMRFLNEVDEVNLRRRDRMVTLAEQALGSLPGKTVAVLGTAFKPNSDDVRDSPALDVAGRLFGGGADVNVYDPKANDNAAKRFPRLNYCSSVVEAVSESDIILLLTEWKEFMQLSPASLAPLVKGRRIIDGRNILDAAAWIDAGWDFNALGLRKTDAGTDHVLVDTWG